MGCVTVMGEGICWESAGELVMIAILAAVLGAKSSSWYVKGVGEEEKEEERRKKRVSEPAPREMICFGADGDCDRKSETRLSMAVVRTYVP